MEIKSINFDYKLKLDIDNVWAQAYALYKSGEKYELTSEEIHENELVNKNFQINSLEMDIIQDLLYPGTSEDHDGFIYPMRFIELILQDSKDMANRINSITLGKAFRMLGFLRGQKYEGKIPRYGYYVKFTNEYLHRFGNTDKAPGSYIPTESQQDDMPF
jgi:hypothetical protein